MADQNVSFVDLRAQYERLSETINARIQGLLDHGKFILGPEVGELEQHLAEFAACRHAVTVSRGTDALLATLMDWEFGAGEGSLPVAKAQCRKVLSLPMHPYMPPHMADHVCDRVTAAIEEAK